MWGPQMQGLHFAHHEFSRREVGCKNLFVLEQPLSKPNIYPFVIKWTKATWHISIDGVLLTQGKERNWEMGNIHRAITEPVNEVYMKVSRELMKNKDFGIYVEQLGSLIRVPMRVPLA